jgi:hypothetical protein
MSEPSSNGINLNQKPLVQHLLLQQPPQFKATVYTQVESELVSIREEWTQSVAARVLK